MSRLTNHVDTKEWIYRYVWEDSDGEIHVEEQTIEAIGCLLVLNIPMKHAIGLIAGPWLGPAEEA